MPKVLFIVEVPTPQRTPVFNQLAERGLDFGVLYLRKESPLHGWGDLDVRHRAAFLAHPNDRRAEAQTLWRVATSANLRVLAPFGYRGRLRFLALVIARIRRIQVVTRSDSNPAGLANDRPLKVKARAFALRVAFPPSTRVWIVGEANGRFWRHYVRRLNTVSIPYSTPKLPASTGTAPRMRTSDPKAMRLLFVGRLVEVKSVDLLVRAFRRLVGPEYQAWSLDIVGDGPLLADLKAQSAGDSRIRFCGARPYDKLDEFYLASDVLILPSVQEAWGLVVNEALAFGLWAIVSDRVGAKELLVDTTVGAVFEAGDVDALQRALMRAPNYLSRCPVPPSDPTSLMEQDLLRLMRLGGHGK